MNLKICQKLKELWHSDYIRHFIIAILVFLFVIGFRESYSSILDKFVIPITDFKRNVLTDIFFGLASVLIILELWHVYICKRKIASLNTMTYALVAGMIYGYYRFLDKQTYYFIGYGDGCLKYMDLIFVLCAIIFLNFIITRFKKIDQTKKVKNASDTSQKDTGTKESDINNQNGEIETSDFVLEADEPIVEDKDDKFNYKKYADIVTEKIKRLDVSNSSFSLGIEGQWGQGKTSFANLIKNNFSNDNNYIVINFNPRSSSNLSAIQRRFFELFCNKLSEYSEEIDNVIDKYANVILAITGNQYPILNTIKNSFVKELDEEEYRNKINKIIQEIDKKIIVFIDDTDRLTAEELIEVFKLIDRNASFVNTIFITTYDKLYVSGLLDNYTKNNSQLTSNYSDKFFNTEIMLPSIDGSKLIKHLCERLRKVTKDTNLGNIINVNIKTPSKYIKTIRDVKRYYNLFVYDYVPIKDDVNLEEFILITLLKYVNVGLYLNLKNRIFFNTTDVSKNNNSKFYEIEDRKEAEDIVGWDIIKELFITKVNSGSESKSIRNIYSFDKYFYGYEVIHLFDKDFKDILSKQNIYEVVNQLLEWRKKDYDKEINNFLENSDLCDFNNQNHLRNFLVIAIFEHSKYIALVYKINEYFVSNWQYDNGYTNTNNNVNSIDYLDIKEDIDNIGNIKRHYSFKDEDEYKKFLLETSKELSKTTPKEVYDYFARLLEEKVDVKKADVILEEKDINEVLKETLENYLKKIHEKDWKATNAYLLAGYCPPNGKFQMFDFAKDILRDAMLKHPEYFSNNIFTHGQISFDDFYIIIFPILKPEELFPGKGLLEFIDAVNSSKNIDDSTKEQVKKIWDEMKKSSNSQIKLSNPLPTDTRPFDYATYIKYL